MDIFLERAIISEGTLHVVKSGEQYKIVRETFSRYLYDAFYDILKTGYFGYFYARDYRFSVDTLIVKKMREERTFCLLRLDWVYR